MLLIMLLLLLLLLLLLRWGWFSLMFRRVHARREHT